MAINSHSWYKLDNAAKIYPAIMSDKRTSTFRISAILYEVIDPEILQKALCAVKDRFPTLFVTIRKGLFWYFFEPNNAEPIVWPETTCPCRVINRHENNGYLFKVYYYDKRISVECFHSLTDGSGVKEFLKTLIYQYLSFKGYDVDCEDLVKVPYSHPSKQEIEDSFINYYDKKNVVGRDEPLAEHIEGIPFEDEGLNIIHGILSASKLNTYAKSQGMTITIYLASLLIYAIYEENMKYGNYHNPIKLSIPVNLRKIFPSQTMRNFASYINVGVMPTHTLTMEAVVRNVTEQLKEGVKKQNLYPRINANVKSEKHPVVRGIPLVLKNIVLREVGNRFGERLITSTLSNLGVVKVPKSMEEHIDYFTFILPSAAPNPLNLAVCSFNDKLSINFSRSITEPNIIRNFFRTLVKDTGLDVRIYSNDWGLPYA